MTRYNHAYTLAFEVICEGEDGCTPEEYLAALQKRVRELESDPDELRYCALEEAPFDSYACEEGEG